MFNIRYPEDLPISMRRSEIIASLRSHQVVVIAGETGSGKTTQLPKMCLDAGLAARGKIGCTQPRRVAAMSISRRVAEELGVAWGREVGCKMRFNDDTSPETRVKFMTDGILLAEIQSDPLLRAYSALIIDEAHERSLNIDFLLGYLNGLLKRRPELKLIITSATIDTEAFSKAFNDAPIIEVSGRLWGVEVRYQPLESFTEASNPDGETLSHIEAAVVAVENALLESEHGDVLVFMPTERDIRETREFMEERLGRGTEVLGLYGRMPAADQQRIFAPGPRRRVIIATNVAETSLTLPRIRYVVDSGLSRMSRYNPRTRTKRLPIEDISQSSANQRAGRAGRIAEGIAIRLYSEEDFLKRPRFTQPEIQRANLAEVILRMKAFGLGEIETFPFIDPPQQAAIRAGYRLLHELGAITELNVLTQLGKDLARLPLDPTLGRMLLQALKEGVLPQMLVIASGLSIPDPRERPEDQKEAAQSAHQKFAFKDSDFVCLLQIWKACPEAEGRGGTNALRKFCKSNFLSFTRMREWRDIHRQLSEVFSDDLLKYKTRTEHSTTSQATANASRRDAPSKNAIGATLQNAANSSRSPHSGHPAHSGQEAPSAHPAKHKEPLKGARNSNAADDEWVTVSRGVHRSILSGLLGHIAQREGRNQYKASGNRLVTLFPGSTLYARGGQGQKKRNAGERVTETEKKQVQPEWIVSAEIVETSQLFARTAAKIDPEWAAELGAHLCETRHHEPSWSTKASRVLCIERILLHGLLISKRHADYGKINPVHATELFIRGALVAEEAHIPLPFFLENRRTRDRVETALTRVRHHQAQNLDEAMYRFYAARIENVSSIHDLHRLYTSKTHAAPDYFHITEKELVGETDTTFDRTQFPDKVELGTSVLPLNYAFSPGEDSDGVTVQVPLPVAAQLTSGQLQWMVPGLRQEQIQTLLRALPKTIRRQLMPLDVRAAEVAREFDPGRGDFQTALATFLTRKYRVAVNAADWPEDCLPNHLRPRVEVVDKSKRSIVTSRDLPAIQEQVNKRDHRSSAWRKTASQFEREGLTAWTIGNIPESVFVEEIAGEPLHAFPGLEPCGESVNLRLFRDLSEARKHTGDGIRKLVELAIGRDLIVLRKELQQIGKSIISPAPKQAPLRGREGFASLGAQLQLQQKATTGDLETFLALAIERLVEHAFRWDPLTPLEEKRFQAFVEAGRRALPGHCYQMGEYCRQIVIMRETVLKSPKRFKGMETEVERIAPKDLLTHATFERLQHVPRYLKAVLVRAERAVLNPNKDAEKHSQLAPFANWQKHVPESAHPQFRWMLEELRVSIFAQELGTAESVSVTKLKAMGNFA
jgi:ATP-dependent helicase HrpA